MKWVLVGVVLFFLLIPNLASATDLYVRPAGGSYGVENGTDYDNAWDGLGNIVWGSGGVQAGDTLWVCGLHLRTYTAVPASEIITIGANGLDDSSRITIRGDCPGDQGTIWGAGLMGHEPWIFENGSVWSITTLGSGSSWYFEDITPHSWTVLNRVNSFDECQNTPGTYFSQDYSSGNKLFVHASDSLNPNGRIAANGLGYDIKLHGSKYINWKNLRIYNNYRFLNWNTQQYISYTRFENCTIWYGGHTLFHFRGKNNHHFEFINNDLAWATNGVAMGEAPYGFDGGPHHYVFRGNKVHDIGIKYADSDSHALSSQASHDGLIENNELYRTGTGITIYVAANSAVFNQDFKNVVIRHNWIHDTHSNASAGDRGIEFNGDGRNTGDKSGNKCYGNLVGPNVHDICYRYIWSEYEVDFYNNIAYGCDTSFYVHHNYNNVSVNVKIKNSISLYPKTRHIEFSISTKYNETDFHFESDYNIFYPISGNQFRFYDKGTLGYMNFTEWQAVTRQGSTFDPHSLTFDPLLVDPASGNFSLQSLSPAIDNGTDVGLLIDYAGNQIPYGVPDIGAYEFGSSPPPPCSGTCRENNCSSYADCAPASGMCIGVWYCCSGTCIDSTPPSIPSNVNANPFSQYQIDLAWDASSDPETGVDYYNIYRDDSYVGQLPSTSPTSYSDTGLTEDTTYTYEISAVNTVGLESARSSPVQATTLPSSSLPAGICNGLVLLHHYDNDQNYGETSSLAYDFSDNGNNATCSNCPDWNSTGKYSGAFAFDGINDQFTVPHDPMLNVDQGNLTISAWVYVNDFDNNDGIVDKRHSTSSNYYSLCLIAARNARFFTHDGSGYSMVASNPLLANTWYHIVAVVDQSDPTNGIRLYIDGILKDTSIPQSPVSNSLDLLIGRGLSNRYFKGMIDEVAIWKRPLSQQEVSELYGSSGPIICQTIPGDLNSDGFVNILDMGIVSLDFGRTSGFDIRADTNSDGEVDIFDIVFVASRFT